MKYDLNKKVVLITGAAGGIGAATAREFYALGANLVLTDMQQEAVDKLASEFEASRVLPLALDVTDAVATKDVVQKIIKHFGHLDIAFANAGISWRDGASTIASCDEAEFDKIVEVDLLGVWRTVRAALPEVTRNKGQILITSSVYCFGMANTPIAQALQAKGAKLALLDLDLNKVESQAKQLGGQSIAAGWVADVRSLESLETAMANAAQHFGKIDVVIANAGIASTEALEHMAPETFERTIDINLTGVFRTFRAAIPYVKQTQGYLLAVSSMAAFVHSPLNTHYTSSKAGVWALCDSLRLELKYLNVGVGSLHPTFFKTPLMDNIQNDPAGKAVWKGNSGIWKYISIGEVVSGVVESIERRKDMTVVPKINTPIAKAPALFRNVIEFLGFNRKQLKQTMLLAEKNHNSF
ncbi:SDR family NAD(P)-dependent oxidoreductase [Acinetobacter baumannii]